MPKVIFESLATVKGRVMEGIALTPTISKNRNAYPEEEILKARNLNTPLIADWEHTAEKVGNVVFKLDESVPAILYRVEVNTERASELKEGVHLVSIEANVDNVYKSCTKNGCMNVVEGITMTGIGITTNPSVRTTTGKIIESFQDWPVINKLCESCMSDCLQAKSDKGIEIDDKAKAICYSECGESVKEEEELKIKVADLEKKLTDLTTCKTCGKHKKL